MTYKLPNDGSAYAFVTREAIDDCIHNDGYEREAYREVAKEYMCTSSLDCLIDHGPNVDDEAAAILSGLGSDKARLLEGRMAHPVPKKCLNCDFEFFIQCICGKRLVHASKTKRIWLALKKALKRKKK